MGVYYPLPIREVDVYFARTRTNENVCTESNVQSEQFFGFRVEQISQERKKQLQKCIFRCYGRTKLFFICKIDRSDMRGFDVPTNTHQ